MEYTFATQGSPLSSLMVSDCGDDFDIKISHEEKDGIIILKLTLTSEAAKTPPHLNLFWRMKALNTLCQWRPDRVTQHHLKPSWSDDGLESRSTSQAPVICLHDMDGTNRLTFAVDDCLHPVLMKCGVDEHTADMECQVYPFQGTRQARTSFEVLLYINTRTIPFYQTLSEVSKWWANMDGYTPIPVPNSGKLPMYSTWYSYHQGLTNSEIEKECVLSKEIGCKSVIVDDGWQTNDTSGGYAFTGDWQAERLTDIGKSVERIHNMDMKYLLWYSVPFVGYKSSHYETFKNKFINHLENLNCAVLDPRYPDVREYLIKTYVDALNNWNLDGFKLDFVDRFIVPENGPESTAPGRDYDCVYEGANKLLSDVIDRLRQIKPDIMIEFRQKYIGPLMRRYGNLFRAGDCPMDAVTNRVRTLDIRLLADTTATHADMLMWHMEDSTENAARQFLNILFSVPQISVRLAELPADHMAMLKHYLAFWCENRDVLMDGTFMPQHPEALYTSVIAKDNDKTVIALYTTNLVELSAQTPITHIVNATGSDKVTITNLSTNNGMAKVFDCMGKLQQTIKIENIETATYTIPVSGRMEIVD